jgi:hypothetical protein
MRGFGLAAFLLTVSIAAWVLYEPDETVGEEDPQNAEDPDVVDATATLRSPTRSNATPTLPAADSASQTEWPVPPATLESKFISALLGLPGLENVVVYSSECSWTKCEVHVTASNADRNYHPVFSVIVNDLAFPRNISFRAYVELAEKYSRDFDVIRIDTDLGSPPDPSVFFIPAELLQDVAEFSSSANELALGPRELFDYDAPGGGEVRILLEEICEEVCSFGSQQLIHIEIPEGLTCEQLQGVEHTRLVGTEAGGVVERTFCVPNTLIQE